MQVSLAVFYTLYWGIPVLIALLAVAIAVKLPSKKIKGLVIVAGFIGASAYYFWFELAVKFESLTVYTAQSCSQSDVRYHLPFGAGVQVNINNTLDGPARTLGYYAGHVAITNQTSQPLLISEAIYTHEGAPARSKPTHDGYIIPAGETHALQITDNNLYFLKDMPEIIRVSTSGFELHQYGVQCALTP
jgi:hypothetical protein